MILASEDPTLAQRTQSATLITSIIFAYYNIMSKCLLGLKSSQTSLNRVKHLKYLDFHPSHTHQSIAVTCVWVWFPKWISLHFFYSRLHGLPQSIGLLWANSNLCCSLAMQCANHWTWRLVSQYSGNINTMYTKMERQHTEPGSDPKSTNLLTKYQSASAN